MLKVVFGAALAALAVGTPVQSTSQQHSQKSYEYVVIGSGPGGGTLAANLARAGHSVFLIEAGEDHGDSLLQRVPAMANAASEAPDMSWQFFVNHFQNETQARRDNKYTYRLNNGSFYVGLDPPSDAEPLGIFYPRGNALGGSSQVNAMNFALPPDEDWMHIAQLTGDNSWQPQNMRKYFQELEKNEYLPQGVPGHGYDGYIASTQNNLSFVTGREGVSTLAKAAIELLEGKKVTSTKELSDLLDRDMNRFDPARYTEQGVYRFPLHADHLKQRSSANNYVRETLNAKNSDGSPKYPLTLSTNSLASKVLFCKTNGKPRASGVEYMVGEALYAADRRYDASIVGKKGTVRASREVIVAGGAFNTPQILKLSGIGPREELQQLNISVVSDLPAVGNYMQDNYEGGVSIRANIPWDKNPFANCNPSSPSDPCLAEWNTTHTGPYGEGGAPLAMWFKSSVSENANSDIFFFGAANAEFRGYWPGYSTAMVPNTTFFWSMVKMQMGNEAGTVKLRSANPRDTPLIDFNWFEQNGDRDLTALAEGAEFAMKVFDKMGEPYAPYKVVEPTPGLPVKQALKDNVFSHHVTSTCRMGPAGDKNYCVDSKFKVNGIDGLRVVDASIFPRTPGAFPVAPTFVVSRKAFHQLMSELKHH